VWRAKDEAFVKSCIRERWKGYQEFMFWGCFSYNKKGPCHIWKLETAAERKAADKHLIEVNAELEPYLKGQWELETGMRRLGLRNKAGKKPEWKLTKANGKLTRGKGKGIDWYCYQQEILIRKLLPFATVCKSLRPGTIVQEDGAPSHASSHQAVIYQRWKIERLLWAGNSPDLNMIEPSWGHLKRVTTKKGAPKSQPEAEHVWKQAWRELEQWRIQAWIERIMRHIQEVIRLKGGNVSAGIDRVQLALTSDVPADLSSY